MLANTSIGRRLKLAFGEHYSEIWWDNASGLIAASPQSNHPANPKHMIEVIRAVNPKAIIAFGNVAHCGMKLIDPVNYNKWHYFPHPSARGLTQGQLNEFAKLIISNYLC